MSRRHTLRVLASLGLLLTVASTARAQVCMGYPSFAVGDLRMTGNVAFGSDTKTIGGSFAFGQATGLFGGPTVDYVSFPAPADKALVYTGTVGWGIDLADRGRIALCPLLVGSYQDGPAGQSLNRRLDITGKSLGAGAAIGGDVPLSPRMHLVPFASVVLTTSTSTTIIQGLIDIKSTATDRYAAITVGVGVVIDKIWTIRPSLSIPAGLQGGTATVGLTLSITPRNDPAP